MKILLVEDDQTTGELLTSVLSAHRYTVDLARDGQTGLELAGLWKYDLILLDVELPRLDGISVCRQLRNQEDSTPILMLTAKSLNHDIVMGLDAGADDYLIKPCEPGQLLARIRALLRRSGSVVFPLLSWGGLCLDPAAAQVSFQEQPVLLGPKEYNLLELFLRNPQRIFNRSAILDNLWTADDFPTENAVTNLIKDLRRKLKAAGMTEDLIETIYGLGYRLRGEPEKGVTETVSTQVDRTAPADYEEGVASINQLAEQFRESLEQRLNSLVSAVRSLQRGDLEPAQQSAARQDAHRLAGALGMFGYAQGTETARTVEQLLLEDTPEKQQIVQSLDLLAALQHEIAHPPIAPRLLQSAPPAVSLVLLLDAGSVWLETLQRDRTQHPFRLQGVSPETFAPDQLMETPQVVMVTWHDPVPTPAAIAQVEALTTQFPTVPFLVLAIHDTLINRVTAAQLGCQRFLCYPASASLVWETIAQVTQCARSQTQHSLPATVMVVDDDPVIIATMTTLLHPWGIKVIGIVEPEQFWDVLTQTHPDLLILDLELPAFSGIDLCRVVRQDPLYHPLPIVVITAHRDPVLVQQVFDAGADDLAYKPIMGSEVVTRIINRIERAQLRQQIDQMQQQQWETLQQESRIDVLTQIANRRRFDEFLAREWVYHKQAQVNLSLILCDVDYFKQFNDRYGHLAGDSCLKQIAQVLQACINPTVDLVARYGGEEFGIVLPNTDLNGALRVVRRIQQAIAGLAIPHVSSLVNPCLTVSMGITGTVPTADLAITALITTADEALYAAKERGRNTYCLYPL